MNNLSALILTWGPIIVQIVLLSLQIYTYFRTSHYSLVLLAAGTAAGLLTLGLGRILNSELLTASMRVWMLNAILILYSVYMVLAIWGVVALLKSYRQLTDANKQLKPTAG